MEPMVIYQQQNHSEHISILHITCCNKHVFENDHCDDLVQERRNSIANALELHLSCTNPSFKNACYFSLGPVS